jgi:peptidoglycan-associated lipoprotein
MSLKALASAATLLALVACSSNSDDTSASRGAGSGTGTGGIASNNLGGGAGGAITPGSQQDLEKNVGDRIFFNTDKSDITSEGRETLQRQAQWLMRYPNVTVTIEGHCDERGTREYNLALGERRASAAKQVLVTIGISGDRIKTTTYGKERPAVVGSNEAAWAQNRRAVTTVD